MRADMAPVSSQMKHVLEHRSSYKMGIGLKQASVFCIGGIKKYTASY